MEKVQRKVSKEFKNVFKINIAIESENRLNSFKFEISFNLSRLKRTRILLLLVLPNKTLKKILIFLNSNLSQNFLYRERTNSNVSKENIS